MSGARCGLAAAAVLGALFGSVGPAHAAIIGFEDLGIGVGTQLNPPAGIGIITGGFNYTPGPNNDSGLNDLHIGNQVNFFPWNGTTVGVTHDDVVLTKVGLGAFSLQGFDMAGWPTNFEVAFTVTGIRVDNTMITQRFTPDGLVDGPGGVQDFQTFTMVGDWTNLRQVTWEHFGPNTTQGLFGLDNIRVDEVAAVPEPSTLVIGTLATLGMMLFRVRRRRVVG